MMQETSQETSKNELKQEFPARLLWCSALFCNVTFFQNTPSKKFNFLQRKIESKMLESDFCSVEYSKDPQNKNHFFKNPQADS